MNDSVARKHWVRAMVVCLCLNLFVSAAQAEDPRLITYVHPYAGDSEEFEKFWNVVEFQLAALGEQLEERAPCQRLSDLEIARLPADLPRSRADLEAAWERPQTLQLWRGNVDDENNQVFIVTYAYLGRALGKLESTDVGLEQQLSRTQNRNVKNSHMAITAYALAMDLQNNGKPASDVLKLLSEAQERAGELDTQVPGHKQLQDAIASSIEELRN